MIGAYVSPRIGDVPLQQLSALELDRLYATLATEGRQRGGGGLSLRTVRYAHAILSKALGDAERKGLVGAQRGPAELAAEVLRRPRAPEQTTWTPDELALVPRS